MYFCILQTILELKQYHKNIQFIQKQTEKENQTEEQMEETENNKLTD